MADFYKDYLVTLKDLIHTALDNNDTELLNGIQSLEVSVWMGLEGPAAVIQSLIIRTADMKKEAVANRNRIASQVDFDKYTEIGVINALENRIRRLKDGRIQLDEFLHNLRPLTDIKGHLLKMRDIGFVDLKGSTRYNATVRLSSLWDGLIDGIANGVYDADVFPYSLGKMIAMAIKEKGISSLKPIIRALNQSQATNGEYPTKKLLEYYNENSIGIYHFDRALCRDRSKEESIRLFDLTDPQRVIFTQHALRTQREWLNLARARSIQRGRRP